MKKSVLVLATLVAALGLSACNDYSSPEAVLGSAYTAVRKGNLKELRETMTGNALAAYGNEQGLAALQAGLSGMQVKTGEKQYLGGEKHSWRHYTYRYQVEVLVRPGSAAAYEHFKTATVVCDWTRGYTRPSHDPYGGPDLDTPDSEECLIAELN